MGRVNSKIVFHTFLANLAISGSSVATGIITARLLLPAGRGELATVMLWPAILAALGIMGTNWAITREAAARAEKEADFVHTVFILSIILAGVMGAIGYFLIPYLLPADKQHLIGLTRIYLLLLPLNFMNINLLALDHGRMHWRRFNLLRLSVVIPYLIIILVFWIIKIGKVEWFILALLISNLFTLILLWSFHWREIIHGRTKINEMLSLVKKGLPFFYASFGLVLSQQLDKALVVSLLSTKMVGYYAAAFSFASAHASLGLSLGLTSFAALANESDFRSQGQYLSQVFRQATLLYIGAGAAVALLAPLVIVPLFGASFAPAVGPAVVLSLATSLASLGNIMNEGLRGLGITYPGIVSQLLGGGVLGLGAWQLVPKYGLSGMAWAAVFGALTHIIIQMGAAAFILKLSPSQLWGIRLTEMRILYGRLLAILPLKAGS